MVDGAREKKFVRVLSELGGNPGIGPLPDVLGWQEAVYDAVKEALRGDGQIRLGRGRGGSVALADATTEEAPPVRATPAAGPAEAAATLRPTRVARAKPSANSDEPRLRCRTIKVATHVSNRVFRAQTDFMRPDTIARTRSWYVTEKAPPEHGPHMPTLIRYPRMPPDHTKPFAIGDDRPELMPSDFETEDRERRFPIKLAEREADERNG